MKNFEKPAILNILIIYSKAVELHNDWRGYNNIACLYINEGDLFSAVSHLDKAETIKKIQVEKDKFKSADSLPSIYLLHGDLTLEQMALLYNLPKIKAMLSCTHGEGFGRPLAEATCCDLPVIASGWSGQMDFLNGKQSTLIEGELKPIPKDLIWKPIIG